MLADYKTKYQIAKNSFCNNIKLESDDQKMIIDFIKNKRDKLLNREGVLNQLFGIQNYVHLNRSTQKDYTQQADLLETCVKFINDWRAETPPALVLEGKSGGGKSLFLIEFLRHIN